MRRVSTGEKVGPNGKAIGIDMTPEMIELSRKSVAKAGLTNVEFHLASIDKLPLSDARCYSGDRFPQIRPKRFSEFAVDASHAHALLGCSYSSSVPARWEPWFPKACHSGWYAGKPMTDFHNRYVLTNRAGIGFLHGLDDGPGIRGKTADP